MGVVGRSPAVEFGEPIAEQVEVEAFLIAGVQPGFLCGNALEAALQFGVGSATQILLLPLLRAPTKPTSQLLACAAEVLLVKWVDLRHQT